MEKSEIKFAYARIEKCKRHELEAMQEAKALFDEIREKFHKLFNNTICDITDNQKNNLYIHAVDSNDNEICFSPSSYRINPDGSMWFEGYPYDSECVMKISDIVAFGSTYDYINMSNILMEKINKIYGIQYGKEY